MPEVNLWAVLAAGVASMVIGGLWYSPVLFGKTWVRLMKFTDTQQAEMKKGAGKMYAAGLVTALVTAYVLSLVIHMKENVTLPQGLLIGLGVWFGFTATVQFGSVLWESKPFSLFLLNTAYSLVSLLVAGAILTAWV